MNITSHLDQQRMFTDVRHGFRKSRSHETQLIKTANEPAKSLNESQQVDSILMDFSKTFDVVCHRKRLLKLEPCGIRCENLK